MNAYMKDITHYKRITVEDEFRLAAQVSQGSEPALETLITSNLRFVISIAHEFKASGVPVEDLIQYGNLGLMKAARRFDPNKGAKFSTYSQWWIKQSIRLAISHDRTIRVPVTTGARIKKIKDAFRELGPKATFEDVAKAIDLPAPTVKRLSQSCSTVLSLNKFMCVDSETEWLDTILCENKSVPDELINQEDREYMMHLLTKLKKRERYILARRFGFIDGSTYTLQEVSDTLGITRERIRQIQNIALKKLLNLMNEKA